MQFSSATLHSAHKRQFCDIVHWPVFQTDGDSSADDDEVFNDPDDTWEKETPSPSSSPVV